MTGILFLAIDGFHIFFIFIEEITVWNVFYNYLVYKPTAPDEGNEYFYIVDLSKGTPTTVRVKDFTKSDKTCKFNKNGDKLILNNNFSRQICGLH